MLEVGDVGVARLQFHGLAVEEILRNVEQAQTLGARAGAFGRASTRWKMFSAVSPTSPPEMKRLTPLDVPGAVGLLRSLRWRADVGARVGFLVSTMVADQPRSSPAAASSGAVLRCLRCRGRWPWRGRGCSRTPLTDWRTTAVR